MSNEKVLVEFEQEELDDLIDELIKVSDLLENGTEQLKIKYENDEYGHFYLNLHNARIKTINDTLEKLLPKSDYYNGSVV